MKRILTLLFLIIFSFSINAQQSKIDSLKIEFKNAKSDSTKAKILADIGIVAYYIDLDLAKRHNDTLIEFSKTRSKRYLAQGYRMRGTFYLLDGDFNNSLKNYKISYNIFKEMKDIKRMSILLGNIATLYGRHNNKKKANELYLRSIRINDSLGYEKENYNSYLNLAMNYRTESRDYTIISEYLLKALEIADKHNLTGKSHVHNELATNYVQSESYSKAEHHIKKAIEIGGKEKNTMSLTQSYQCLGLIYEKRDGDYANAVIQYEKALKYAQQMSNKQSIVTALYSAGFYYQYLNNKPKSLEYLKEGLSISKKIGDNMRIIRGNYHLANFYANAGNQKKAKFYLSEANRLVSEGSKKPFVDLFIDLGKSFKSLGNYEEAYNNIYNYVVLNDSINKKYGSEKIASLETKYESEKKEKENLQLKADNAEQALLTQKANNRNWLLALGILILGISSFLIFRRYKSEAKAKATILNQKNTIENLQKELHHRVKNNLAIIDTFIEVAREEFTDKKFDIKLREIQNRISSINEIHKQLYRGSDVTNLNIKVYVDILSKNVAQSFINKNININNNIENINLNADKSFPVGLIINEFLTNSYKHAFEDSGTINIEMRYQEENYLLSLSDNGKGLPSNFNIDQIDTFGLRIVKLLTKQMDGVFNLENNKGVHLTIQIPKV
jgi:two-component sensor histidine kinase/tetratricopeptide (TPR) repeat protein